MKITKRMKKERSVPGAEWLFPQSLRFLVILILAMGCSACVTNLQTRVSENLNKLSPLQTMAILPVEVKSDRQMEIARMFRQNLHAQLRPSEFILLEPYVVDGLLKRNGLIVPAEYAQLDPMKFGEALGVDAVLISRINKIEKSYFLVHSSIELSVSVQMVDTRSGEILWQVEHTELDTEGILKIPTSIVAAVIAPIYMMTSKLKLREMTSTMVSKLTSIIRHPNEGNDGKILDELKIASAWNSHEGEKDTDKVYWAQLERPDSDKETQTVSGKPLVLEKYWEKLQILLTVPVSKHVSTEKEPGLELKPQVVPVDEKRDPSIWF
jgi:hypothetical protein